MSETLDFQSWRCHHNNGHYCPPEGCPVSYGCARDKGWRTGMDSPRACQGLPPLENVVSRHPLSAEILERAGYIGPRLLPSGVWAALQPMMFTVGLFLIEDQFSWRTRWRYEHFEDASAALTTWDGVGDPPGCWIKQKPEDRLNPNWSKA